MMIGSLQARDWQVAKDHTLKGIGNNPTLEEFFVRLPFEFLPLGDQDRAKVIKNKQYLIYKPKGNALDQNEKIFVWQAKDKSRTITIRNLHFMITNWHLRMDLHSKDTKKLCRSFLLVGNNEGWNYVESRNINPKK